MFTIKLAFILVLSYLAAGSYAFLLGALITSREVLIILLPLIVIPMSLLSGWFVRLDGSVTVLWPFQWISVFKFCFNGLLHVFFQNSHKFIE